MTTAAIAAPPMIALPGARWAAATIADVRQLNETDLSTAVAAAYHALRDQLIASVPPGQSHIVRMWNFIPGITDAMADGRDRYMAFNAGRFAAMCDWFGGADQLPNRAPAATGVGCAGETLHIHALASDQPGVAIQNPRQTPAMHYSSRFGPLPPCFARATRVGQTLLVSGTAAIRGEESIATDLAGQLNITFDNLAALTRRGLREYRQLRVYLPDLAQQSVVADQLRSAVGTACEITFLHAALCRRELLVEIEGVAGDISSHGGAI